MYLPSLSISALIHHWVKRRNWKRFINHPEQFYRNGPTKPVPGTTARQAITLRDPTDMIDSDITIAYKWIYDSEHGKLPRGTPPFQWVGGDYPDIESPPPSPPASSRAQGGKKVTTKPPPKPSQSKSKAKPKPKPKPKARFAAETSPKTSSAMIPPKNAVASSSTCNEDLEFIDLGSVSMSNPNDSDDEDILRPPKVPTYLFEACLFFPLLILNLLYYLRSQILNTQCSAQSTKARAKLCLLLRRFNFYHPSRCILSDATTLRSYLRIPKQSFHFLPRNNLHRLIRSAS